METGRDEADGECGGEDWVLALATVPEVEVEVRFWIGRRRRFFCTLRRSCSTMASSLARSSADRSSGEWWCVLADAGENSIEDVGAAAATAEAIVEVEDEDVVLLLAVVPNLGEMGGGELVNRRAA